MKTSRLLYVITALAHLWHVLTLAPPANAQPTPTNILSETFEGAFPEDNGWAVGDSNPSGTPAYWDDVNAAFGGEGTHTGNWKGYCAGVGFVGPSSDPRYQTNMAAYMSRALNLAGYSSATLSFWYKLPFIESCCDVCRVYVDGGPPLWSQNTEVPGWTGVTLDLSAYVGGTHTLTFEFVSDYSVAFEGWYLDDILVTAVPGAPPNDYFANCTPLAGVPGSASGNNINATEEMGEPGNGGRTVWYCWTPLTNGCYSFDTFGSSFDTVLDIYTGTVVNSLTSVAHNDDIAPPARHSQVEFAATAGTLYRIRVDGFGGEQENIVLNWDFCPLPVTLPVYRVTQYGAGLAQATSLANSLLIPSKALSLVNGEVSFLDPATFMAAPTLPVTNPEVISNLLAGTDNPYPGIPIRLQSLDFTAMGNWPVLNSNLALVLAANAFAQANLVPELGTPVICHTTLNAVYTNDSNVVVSNSAHLDTQVHYQFGVAAGYPLKGPGAQVQVAYGATGNVTRLHYAAPRLTPGPAVPIISPSVASNRVARLLDPDSSLRPQLTGRIVYHVPRWPGPPCLSCPPPNVTNIVIPWYEFDGTANVTNPITGEVSTLELLSVLTPATDDTRFVPVAALSASAPGGTQIVASVTVTGGTPPYSYLWGGSSPNVSSNTGGQVAYTPVVLITPPSLEIAYVALRSVRISWPDPSVGFVLESITTLTPSVWTPVPNPVTISNGRKSVTLTANSVQPMFFRLRSANQAVSTTETVTVTVSDANGVEVRSSQTVPVQIVPTQRARPHGASERSARVLGVTDWGTESPYDPGDGTKDRNDWRAGMLAGPGGGVERFLWTGKLAWDLDFIGRPAGLDDSWVDDADIVLYIGHGEPRGIGFTGGPGPSPGSLVYNEAPRAWGNRDQDWMCFLSCSVLLFDHPSGNVWQRWGPNFDGLHILTGFRSGAGIGTGFPKTFANKMLGNQSIVNAWFNAAYANGTGLPAAMGPIGPSGVWGYEDFYWGKGPVGPTIKSTQIHGWWYAYIP